MNDFTKPRVLAPPRVLLVPSASAIQALAFSSDGTRLALARGSSVAVLDVETGIQLFELDLGFTQARRVLFAGPGEARLAVSGQKGTEAVVWLVDLREAQVALTLPGAEDVGVAGDFLVLGGKKVRRLRLDGTDEKELLRDSLGASVLGTGEGVALVLKPGKAGDGPVLAVNLETGERVSELRAPSGRAELLELIQSLKGNRQAIIVTMRTKTGSNTVLSNLAEGGPKRQRQQGNPNAPV